MQNARENPLAAAAAASGALPSSQNNAENLLDIDFDGAAPASAQKEPASGTSGLEGLAGTPQRVASPSVTSGVASSVANNNMEDLAGVFDNGFVQSNGTEDMMNGFASLDLANVSQPPPPLQQLDSQSTGKKTNEDLVGLF